MDDDTIVGETDDDNVVIARAAIREQHDDRFAPLESIAQQRDRPFEPLGIPAAPPDIAGEDVVGNSSGAPIDERGELLHARVRVAPIAENHCRGRTAAERIALRQIRDVEHQRRRKRERDSDGRQHLRLDDHDEQDQQQQDDDDRRRRDDHGRGAADELLVDLSRRVCCLCEFHA